MSIATFVRRTGLAVAVVLLGAVAYLCFFPVPADPVAWTAPAPPGFTGAFAPNTRLSGLRTIDVGEEYGPEHLAMGPGGKLYAAMTSGNLVRMDPDGTHLEVFASTGGRVLGFDFDATGRMFAADAMKGLLVITPDARVTVAAERIDTGDPIRYANSVVVAPDGIVYFTDASARFAPAKWGGTLEASVLDILEQAASGRVLAHDPVTRRTRVVAHGLSFANGIAVLADGHTLLVNETGRYSIWKIDGHARDVDVRSGSPAAQVLLDNLPGYPDNLMRGLEGRIWVGLFRPRNPAADKLASRPFVRKILLRLPNSWLPVGKPYGHVFAIDEAGSVTEDLQDPSGAYPETTGVTETAERLYIHSLHAPAIGWLPRSGPAAGAAASSVEDIHVLRSIREQHETTAGWCAMGRTGFEPFPADAERWFSFWSIESRAADGKVLDAKRARVAELHTCFGATSERARQNFYAELRGDALTFHGKGECVAAMTDFPEAGLFPVRCQLILSELAAPYIGGLLTTNTLTTRASFGGESDPPGYTQASIATIRLWRKRGDEARKGAEK